MRKVLVVQAWIKGDNGLWPDRPLQSVYDVDAPGGPAAQAEEPMRIAWFRTRTWPERPELVFIWFGNRESRAFVLRYPAWLVRAEQSALAAPPSLARGGKQVW